MGVTFENVTKVFSGGRPAVQSLSLEVQSGELLVLIGPSGCGKTTTLRMINRLEEPTSGNIFIDGRNIETLDPIQLRRGIGYAIQQTGLLPHMTVEENIELVPKLLKWDVKRRHARTRELLEMVGMDYETFAHRYPRQLSGGQQQRIGVLRALATDPPVILMDEPFGALDPLSREVLQTELKRIQERLQKTIVFVTHDMDEAMRLGDRIAIFRDGKLLQVSTPEELLRSPKDEFVARFIGRLFVPQKAPVESVRQFMQTMTAIGVQREHPQGGRIVQIADVPLWFWLDGEGILQGTADAMPDGNDLRNALIWKKGDALSVSVRETDSPDKVLARLADEDAEALPVVDERQRLLGVVTRRSAIRTLSGALRRVEA
jgi:osmoprotectant transport system ATP-binding protein